mmetsp:Transcript_37170/g.6637  ORF Transcript_37170/g.6637 Transcript_37170/m.6637 type:complete len:89 (+) Transcript_37170:283-549(+)
MREADYGYTNETFQVFTHLGNILNIGDTVLGYDMTTMVTNSHDQDELPKNVPDVILIKKVYTHLQSNNRKRAFKLNRMNLDMPDDKDY